MMEYEINPFDILSGKVARTRIGTFWFKKAGNNINEDGAPIGILHREDGPAIIWNIGGEEWFLDDVVYRKHEFDEKIKCLQK